MDCSTPTFAESLMKKGNVVLWSLAGVVILVFVAIGVIRSVGRTKQAKMFEPHIESYVQEPKPLQSGGKLKGKLVGVDVVQKEIDDLHFRLPAEMRAESPDEVKTVVQLVWDKDKVAEYGGGKPGWKQKCQVRVVDKQSGALLFTKSFVGSDPPLVIRPSQSAGWGDKPRTEIVSYLCTLPHE
jgi:hypothetical protein